MKAIFYRFLGFNAISVFLIRLEPSQNTYWETQMSPRTTLIRYAAKTAAGAGLGSHGPEIGASNRAMSSDPQSPQRRPDDVETVSQFPQ